MKDVYEMGAEEFKAALEESTTPEDVWNHSSDIYEYLSDVTGQNCFDSVLREWAFEWSCDKLDRPYEDIYNKWMEG